MHIILLEKIENLGDLGSMVEVKDGFARNFLLPRNKALRATKSNIEHFKVLREKVIAENNEKKAVAQEIADKIENDVFSIIKQAADDGRLFGSVSSKEIANLINNKHETELSGTAIKTDFKLKELGIYEISVSLHPEVKVKIKLKIARNESEANSSE